MNAPAAAKIERGERITLNSALDPAGSMAVAQQRLMVIMLLFGIITLVITLRLVQICLISGKDGRNGGAPVALRGEILDRNGMPLATTIKLWSIAINPQEVLTNKDVLAANLARLMPEHPLAWYRTLLHSKTRKFAYLRHPASPNLAQAVQALGEPALKLAPEPHRLFPQGILAGHLLGYSQMVEDGHRKETLTGIGIERAFDDQLKAGQSVTLAVDARVQAAVEKEVQRRILETSAEGGAGVVLDVDTGEVLAMASLPDINPNAPLVGLTKDNQRIMINKVTQATYEHGSTFKMLTFANAIENGVITDWSHRYDVTSPIRLGRFTIKDDEPKHRPITTPEVMTFSSNIGTAQIADQLGAQRVDSFFRKFGLNKRTDIEIRERGQPLYPSYWAKSTVMTTAFGHGIAVTPLHVAQAFAALANGGILHPATLLKHKDGAPVPGTRVVSEATSARIRQLMRLVVLQGTGTNADAPGLRVGGKTGTAEKVNEHGGYNRNANVTVFAGVFPMDHPRYVTLVVLDNARPSKQTFGFKTAGWMTAPLGKRIIARIGPLLGVRPDLSTDIDVSDLMPLILEKKVPGKNAIE
ncbi:peptidoglycan D,D-transpeptidase FtsI family protein [Sphingomonas sp. MMS24-J13]|uniref:peptidoglycan D,D-transpeptidase FtsI family protein n=1 Tax=Sphingomonas sp. MMS24-J13 TaxID=3238686 RepID=UPI00384C2F85